MARLRLAAGPSHAGNHRHRSAAGRSLVLGAAGNIDSARPRESADQSADRGTGVARRADIGIIEHGMAEATHATVGRSFGFGENIDQPILRLRVGKTEAYALERLEHR